MPVSSVSGTLSTSVYFVSLFLLLGVLIPPVKTAFHDADLAAATHLAEGISEQIDALSPGMTTVLKFGSFPGVSASVALSGTNVSASVDGVSASETVVWQLPSLVLSVDQGYAVALKGGVVLLA
ncbi:MAG: hypothetical protein OK474_09790 [Thaumarchaeota archaeon]|nr:hypothetical protein [Nitrososphaerota archaeon]